MHIEHPYYVFGALAVPVVTWLYIRSRLWRKKVLQQFGEWRLVEQLISGRSKARPLIKFAALLLSLLLIIFGLVNVQSGSSKRTIQHAGIDIAVVLDEHHKMAAPDIPGELCLGGVQLTEGYWNDEEKNRQAFFMVNDHRNQPVKYYKTGDLCKTDEAGDIYYMGRLDHQVKVQGYRVELPEIEFHVKNYFEKLNAVVVAYKDVNNNTDLGLVIEAAESDLTGLWAYLNERLPQYMVPKKALFVDPLPLNSNGKTDRNKLTSLFSSNKA